MAHQVGLSRGEYHLEGNELRVEVVFAKAELEQDAELQEAIVPAIEVRSPSGSCPGERKGTEPVEQDGIALRAVYRCSTTPEKVDIHLAFFPRLSHGHRHLATVASGANLEYLVAFESQPDLALAAGEHAERGTLAIAGSLFLLGIEHILTGYDHLLFLFGLILVGGRIRSLFVVITAFTVAHSITLALGALDVWAPSPSIVEPAIALSIVYVGVENWFVADAHKRWMITFPFGLIHGFGFAGVLKEISLPHEQIPIALAMFNLGVEAGQIGVLALLLPGLLWLRQRAWFRDRGVKIASTAIALAGLGWFIERVL
jgi:hydrogenase/urease accessory protein HupE